MVAPATEYERLIFINCPFDEEYRPIFQAVVFAVHDAGFYARCSLEEDNAAEIRLRKIGRIMGECMHGIHDLSRTEIDVKIGLPRLNMSFELGLFMGAQLFGAGRQRRKNCLVLDTDGYRYRNFCSDIAGQDVKPHEGVPERALAAVRDWLGGFSVSQGFGTIPGASTMRARYESFVAQLPAQCAGVFLDPDNLAFVELRTLVQVWLYRHPR